MERDWGEVAAEVRDLCDFIEQTKPSAPGYAMDLAEKTRVAREAVQYPCEGLGDDGKPMPTMCPGCDNEASHCDECAKDAFGKPCVRCSVIVKSKQLHNTVNARHFMRVLGGVLPAWLAIGWVEAGRTHIPSLDADDVLIEYICAGDPPQPSKVDLKKLLSQVAL